MKRVLFLLLTLAASWARATSLVLPDVMVEADLSSAERAESAASEALGRAALAGELPEVQAGRPAAVSGDIFA